MAVPPHPFAVDVKRSRFQGSRFTWTIKRSGVICDRSIRDYGSFEDARLAMKAALTVLVCAWEVAA